MFAKATRNFLKEVDDGGDLISVSHLNDCDKLQLLSLVTKKKRHWCWQRPKYQFLSVTLGDVLTEGQYLSPGMFPNDSSASSPPNRKGSSRWLEWMWRLILGSSFSLVLWYKRIFYLTEHSYAHPKWNVMPPCRKSQFGSKSSLCPL